MNYEKIKQVINNEYGTNGKYTFINRVIKVSFNHIIVIAKLDGTYVFSAFDLYTRDGYAIESNDFIECYYIYSWEYFNGITQEELDDLCGWLKINARR